MTSRTASIGSVRASWGPMTASSLSPRSSSASPAPRRETGPILIAGAAGVVGGAISMALGEYVSVSSQKDSQRSLIEKERLELQEQPEEELEELAAIYQGKGLSPATARTVAKELTAHDALGAHLSAELNIDETDIVSPWHAAFASAIAFLTGAVLPMLAILLPPENIRIPLTFVAVLVALAATGAVGAWIGGGSKLKAAIRVVIGGAAGAGGHVRDRQRARRERHRLRPQRPIWHPPSRQHALRRLR